MHNSSSDLAGERVGKLSVAKRVEQALTCSPDVRLVARL